MSKKDPLRSYYMKGLLLKLIGGIAVASVYAFYYQYGDTISYYIRTLVMHDIFMEDPAVYFDMLFSHVSSLDKFELGINPTDRLFSSDSSFFVIKVGSVLSWFTGNSFYGIAILATLLSYSGIWAMFKLLAKLFPHLIPQLAIAVLYMPSVFFWGSGLLKDAFSIAALGWLLFAIHQLFIERKRILRSIIYIIVACYIIFIVKVYILGTVLPGVLIWLLLVYKSRLKIRVFRTMLVPLVVLMMALGLSSVINQAGGDLTEFIASALIEEVLVKHEYNAGQAMKESDTGSQYELGELEPELGSFLMAIPRMVNITLFRPYPWETRKIVQLISGLESFVVLVFAIILLIQSRIVGFFSVIFRDPALIFFFVFTIIFAFLVGISSGTFGSLVRYKIPCLPFFLTILFAVQYDIRQKRFPTVLKGT